MHGSSENIRPLSDDEENAVARKNVLLYLVCQAFGGASAPINIALGGLVGSYLLDEDKSLATAPVTSYNIGVALGTLIANAFMQRLGRKLGFMIGTGIGITGMICSGLSIGLHGFWLFCGAFLLNGVAGGFVQQYRFAAADRGTPEFKPKAISWILAGGIAAAIIGPQIVIHAGDLAAPVPFAGAFYFATILFALSFIALNFLNPSNLAATKHSKLADSQIRSRSEIARQPRFLVAVFIGTIVYALMAFVMTGAPIAMVDHGHSVQDSTLGIQWHVLAMFGPSFFTGNLIVRFGASRVIVAGLAAYAICGIVAISGVDLMHFWLSLILLGIGWNFGFIGATSMLTSTYSPDEKNRAQGMNDIVLFSTVALASFASGQFLNALGWNPVNLLIFPLSLICLAALLWLKQKERTLVA